MTGPTVLTRMGARLLLLPCAMVAGAMLVKGYADTGDGFSAGVIMAVGIVIQYVAIGQQEAVRLPVVRHAAALAASGILIALVVTMAPVLWGKPLLTHWPPAGDKPAHLGSLELTTAVLFDVGVFLLVIGFIVGTVDLIATAIAAQPREER